MKMDEAQGVTTTAALTSHRHPSSSIKFQAETWYRHLSRNPTKTLMLYVCSILELHGSQFSHFTLLTLQVVVVVGACEEGENPPVQEPRNILLPGEFQGLVPACHTRVEANHNRLPHALIHI